MSEDWLPGTLSDALWRRAGQTNFRFSGVKIHPVDWVDLMKALPAPTGLEGNRLFSLRLGQDVAVKPGWAALSGQAGDRWLFRWDPRFRCGGCGVEISNDEEQDPAFVVPYCPACSRLRRPGMYEETVP